MRTCTHTHDCNQNARQKHKTTSRRKALGEMLIRYSKHFQARFQRLTHSPAQTRNQDLHEPLDFCTWCNHSYANSSDMQTFTFPLWRTETHTHPDYITPTTLRFVNLRSKTRDWQNMTYDTCKQELHHNKYLRCMVGHDNSKWNVVLTGCIYTL